MTRTPAVSLALLAAAGLAAPAAADFVPPDAFGWQRGAADTTYFMWEVFTSPAGPNPPAPGGFPSPLPDGWITPDVSDAAVGSFITGSGNIYNIDAPLIITARTPGYNLGDGYTTRLIVQVRTQGHEIDPATVAVNGVAPRQTQELYREELGGFGGAIVEMLYLFELPGSEAVYTLRFDAAEGSMSLDRLSIDTLTIAGGASCPTDWNQDQQVNSSDISAFLTSWLDSLNNQTLTADFDGNGTVNSSDISAFLTVWLQGVTEGC
jgi:hypothetical protein